MRDEVIPLKVHFLDVYWVDNPENIRRGTRIARTYVVEARGWDSLDYIIHRLVEANRTDFSAGLLDAFKTGAVSLGLIRSDVSVGDWRAGDASHTEGIDVLTNPNNGVVRMSSGYAAAWTWITPEGIGASIAAGYLDARPNEVIVFVNEGVGGDAFDTDFIRWLLEQGVDLGLEPVKAYFLYKVGSFITKHVRYGRRDRRARAVARAWADRQLFTPYQLRVFLDRREKWLASDVSKALTISWETVRQLLTALGYERDAGNVWRIGTSRKAIARRERWISKEFTDVMGNHFDLEPTIPFEG